jgi:hypothetical protein
MMSPELSREGARFALILKSAGEQPCSKTLRAQSLLKGTSYEALGVQHVLVSLSLTSHEHID